MPDRVSDLARLSGRGAPALAGRRAQAREMASGRSAFSEVTMPGGQRAFLPGAGALPAAVPAQSGAQVRGGGPCAACGSAVAGAGEPGPPGRARRWVFPGTADQVRRARSAVAAALDGYPLAGDAVLCVSELATNAVRHSASGWPGGVFAVRAEIWPGGGVHVEVHDEGGPWQSGQDADGRVHGLGIVAELAAGFSVRTAAGGGRIVGACFGWPAGVTRGQR